VSFFSIIAVLIWVRTDSRAALVTFAFMPGVPSPAVSDRTYRYLPAFLPWRQTGRLGCFRFTDIAAA
jgi:hypothetical protein